MRRLARLDVSLNLAMNLLMAWLILSGIFPLPFELGFLACGSPSLSYLTFLQHSFLWGLGGWCLVLGVLGIAWLEFRTELRPWFKRALRLAGQLWITSMLVSMWIFHLWLPS